MAAPKQTVVTKTQYHVYEEAPITAGNAPYPGFLMAWGGTTSPTLSINTVPGASCLVATEDENQGKTIDDIYTAGSRLVAKYLAVGDMFVGYVVAGLAVTAGDLLTSDGTGKVGALLSSVAGVYASVSATNGASSMVIRQLASAQLLLRAEASLTNVATERRIIFRVLRA